MNHMIHSADVKEIIALEFFIMKDGQTIIAVRGGHDMNEWEERFRHMAKQYFDNQESMEAIIISGKGD